MAPMTKLDHLSNALVTSRQLSKLQDGASLYWTEDAQSIRFVQGQLTQAAGILLRLPQEVIANALVILQRFWINFNDYEEDKTKSISAAAVYLTAKLSFTPVSCRSVCNVYAFLTSPASPLWFVNPETASTNTDPQSYYVTEGTYERERQKLFAFENTILSTIGFDTQVTLPHVVALTYLQALGALKPNLANQVLQHLNGALFSPQILYLTHQPNALAVAAIYLAARETGTKLPDGNWWEVFDVEREDLGFLVLAYSSLQGSAAAEKMKWSGKKDCGLPVSRVLRDLIVADGDHELSRYKYPPLPPKCIRILSLAPGQRGTELHGDIVIHDPEEVNYGALSYVWGDAHLTKCIHIGEATLPITESLYSALQQIREVKEEHWIWVDQICVDQESLADRNEQVGRMGEIYARADHVIAWLGQATPGTQYIFQSLAKVGDGARPDLCDYQSEEMEPGRPIYESMKERLHAGLRSIYPDEEDVPDFMDATRDAVHSILSNPWFERTWTLQEAALCEKLFVAAGDLELTWRKLCGFLTAMPELSKPRYAHLDIHSTRRFAIYGFNTTSLYRLVDNYYSRQATDPRDKIYGLMGILDPTRRPPAAEKYGMEGEWVRSHPAMPLADYSKSAEQVYMDFTLWCIHTSGDLEALTRCCSEYQDSTELALPSWTRDWTQKGTLSRCGNLIGSIQGNETEPFYASLDLKAQVRRSRCFPCRKEERQGKESFAGVVSGSIQPSTNMLAHNFQSSPATPLKNAIMHALLVKGLQVDVIEETVDRVHIKGFLRDTESETWREWKCFAMKERPSDRDQYPGHQSRIDALWRTLIKDQRDGHEERARPEDGENFETLLFPRTPVYGCNSGEEEKATHSDEEELEDTDEKEDIGDWLSDHGTTLWGKKLFRTEKGYLGMTCQHVRAGDKVCIFWGGRLPFVVREKGLIMLDPPEESSPRVIMSHVLIGAECYVHGLADGEAVHIARGEGLDAEICLV